MTHAPADVVRWLLVGAGLAGNPEAEGSPWPAYWPTEPGRPDNVITVRDTTAVTDGRSMIDGEVFRHHGLQVRVRAKDDPTGWTKAEAIREEFETGTYDRAVTVDGVSYRVHCFSRIGAVLPWGTESLTSKRCIFTLNAQVDVEQLS